MELIDAMEIVTIVVTLAMWATGLAPCMDMYKTGNTKNVPFLLFLLSVLSCGGMLHYGLMLGNNTLIFLNAVGASLQLLYVMLYVYLVKSKSQSLTYIAAACIFLVAQYTYLYQVVVVEDEVANMLGAVSSAITTVIVVLPVFEIIDNVRNKNTDGMPLIMLLGGLVCGVAWLIYGLMLQDANIYAPNIPGITIGLAKLYVIQLYSKEKTA